VVQDIFNDKKVWWRHAGSCGFSDAIIVVTVSILVDRCKLVVSEDVWVNFEGRIEVTEK
jgi:hypothetical protein